MPAPPTVVLTNSTDAPVAGVASTGHHRGRAGAHPGGRPGPGWGLRGSAGRVAGPATATTFTFAGGGVTGTAVIAGPQGWSTAPCTSQVSPQWDFAGGATATGLLDLTLVQPDGGGRRGRRHLPHRQTAR